MSVFEKHELIKKSLFSSHKNENFLIEVENILAEYEDHFEDVPKKLMTELVTKYKVDFPKKFKNETKTLVRRYWKSILGDMKSTKSEEKQIECLVSLLSVTEEDAHTIVFEEKSAVVNAFVQDLLSDRRYSPEDEERLNQLANDLNVSLDFKDKQNLEKFRILWDIENGNLPVVNDTDITIQKSENVYFKDETNWYEDRQTTTRVSYSGPSVRIKICKGVYYRIGSCSPKKVTTTEKKLIDTGTLYLTNKRLIFVGSKSTKTIYLNKILSIEPYVDGVEIVKESGKFPLLKFSSGDAEVFSLLLTKIVNME